MNHIRPLMQKVIFILGLVGLLNGCDGGGAGTSANPDLSSIATGYSGPPARTADIRSFELNFWNPLKANDRCGQCHGVGQGPEFVDLNDVNRAYAQAMERPFANLQDPPSSRFVTKVRDDDHNCWLTDLTACETIITNMIANWANDSNVTSARQIQLTPPPINEPGEALSFPETSTDFATTVHPVLIGTAPGISTNNCQGCHETTIAPFFASGDVDSAYQAAKAKMDIDDPANSRLVIRLREESHNCWSSDCLADAQVMEDAIRDFAATIDPNQVGEDLLTSKALLLGDGIVAAGGSRHESNLIALWEFKEAIGSPTAFDTSGIEPAVDLTLITIPSVGTVTQMDGYGLDFTGGMARANPFNSDKLQDFIQSSGQYAIEAWVIPANVTQEDANIVGYSNNDATRNFTLGQRMYNYDFFNKTNLSDANGEPFFTSDDGNDNEVLQASLQHVVVNYHYENGRSIYVNGTLVANTTEPTPGTTTIGNWLDTSAFVLGNEVTGNKPWRGKIRMAAVHNRILTPEQVLQNFEVGVGEKYYLLFYVGHQIGIPDSYILFEVAQFDSYSYLFNKPTFINLDPDWSPVAVEIAGMRIGINGKEAVAGQAYASLDVTVGGAYNPQLGEQLSPLGTIIAREKGANDEFFLTFERIGAQENPFTEAIPSVAADPGGPGGPVESDIGVRTFEEINTTIAAITGVPVTNTEVVDVYNEYVQQLPSVEAIDAFLPSHQMAISQLALTSCSELVNSNPGFFTGFNFNQTAFTAFGPPSPGAPDQTQLDNRNLIIDPLLKAALNVDPGNSANNLTSQPAETETRALLGAGTPQILDTGDSTVNYDSLFTTLIYTCTPANPGDPCTPEDTIPRTAQIVKGVCAAATGAAVMLVQ